MYIIPCLEKKMGDIYIFLYKYLRLVKGEL